MYQALSEQMRMPDISALSFEERLGLLVDRELTARDDRRLTTRLHKAKLRQAACIEDIDYRHPRGLDKAVMIRLATCQWVREHHNLLITGPTGIGKTWLVCALGQQACRDGSSVLYLRLPRLLQEMPTAKGDGRYAKVMAALAKTDCIILDDWGLGSLIMQADTTCSSSSRIGTADGRPLSPASFRSTIGMRPSAIPRWRTRSSIAWSTTPTNSLSQGTP